MYGYSPDLHEYIIVVGMASFQGHSLVYRISFDQIDGFLKNVHRYIIWTI